MNVRAYPIEILSCKIGSIYQTGSVIGKRNKNKIRNEAVCLLQNKGGSFTWLLVNQWII